MEKKSKQEVVPKDTEVVAQTTVEAHSPVPVESKDMNIDSFLELRQAFISKVNAICVEGQDYHIIKDKKSLAKGGAEKIASIFHWTAKFDKDQETLDMLGDIKGLVAFKCTLINGQFAGEGRGSALLSKNAGDPNKTVKMAQKSAFIDAVLRASGLSDFFTQDLEDMPDMKGGAQSPSAPIVNIKNVIMHQLERLGVIDKEIIPSEIVRLTQLEPVEANFVEIRNRLSILIDEKEGTIR